MAIEVKENEVLWVQQDKDARTNYKFNLAPLLPDAGDTLTSVSWVPGAGITVDGSFSGTEAAAWISGGSVSTWYSCVVSWQSQSGAAGQLVLRIFILADAELDVEMGSALFPNKFTAIAQLRRDNLLVAAESYSVVNELSDDYLWGKLRAAEEELSMVLRVKFQPTQFFPLPPTQAEIDALNGMPWEEDPAYDYDPEMFGADKWGFLATRQRPIVSVQRLRYSYPSAEQTIFDIPLDWLKFDKKYGQIRIVPTSHGSTVLLNTYLLQLLGASRHIPHMLQLTYVAGLTNAIRDYPHLVDAVKKTAVLKIIEDSFLPQSGSISADGLSQSMSVDMSKYSDSINEILYGPKGSNGGLMAAIHGVKLAVM